MEKTNDKLVFYEIEESGKVKISHSGLIKFLEAKGFKNIRLSESSFILGRIRDNKIKESSIGEIIQVIRQNIDKKSLSNVFNTFVKGMGSYLSQMKLNLLELVELIDDRDKVDSSRFYFNNIYVDIRADKYLLMDYESLDGMIWENRIIQKEFEVPNCKLPGQYEMFCWKLCKEDLERFKAFKSMLGYLLHRYRNKGQDKAVILYDENMGQSGQAHGGTGKSLQIQALKQCREVEVFDGKEIKSGSWFKNQRINLTSDILFYDDLNHNVDLESFFPMITSGIEVEKKGKQAFYIPREKAPKIVLTSNYPVKGPGGPSDRRRRYEFELANYYNEEFTPEIEFGNRFFNEVWSDDEWNKFYFFMISCVQVYLKNGIIHAPEINIRKAKLLNDCSEKFIEYADAFLDLNTQINKREFQMVFEEFYPEEIGSPHMFTKWLKSYAEYKDTRYRGWSSGGKYYFEIISKGL